MLQSKKRWNVQECDEQLVNEFVENLNITPLVASLLLNRGMITVEAAVSFYTLMHKRSTIRFYCTIWTKAVARIQQAIDHNEKI